MKEQKLITIKMDVELLKQFNDYCKEKGLNKSQWIRNQVKNLITPSQPKNK